MQGQLCVPHLLPLALVMLRYPSVELCVGLLQLQKERGRVPGKVQVDETIPLGVTEAKVPRPRTTHTHTRWDGGPERIPGMEEVLMLTSLLHLSCSLASCSTASVVLWGPRGIRGPFELLVKRTFRGPLVFLLLRRAKSLKWDFRTPLALKSKALLNLQVPSRLL